MKLCRACTLVYGRLVQYIIEAREGEEEGRLEMAASKRDRLEACTDSTAIVLLRTILCMYVVVALLRWDDCCCLG